MENYRAFDAILSKKENQYWFQLQPGKMLSKSNGGQKVLNDMPRLPRTTRLIC